jgi:hypothetical protein
LTGNDHVAVVTGCNDFASGLDVIVEGVASRVTDATVVAQTAKLLNEKYDNYFDFTPDRAQFAHAGGGTADLYVVERTKAFAYGRGTASATRYI